MVVSWLTFFWAVTSLKLNAWSWECPKNFEYAYFNNVALTLFMVLAIILRPKHAITCSRPLPLSFDERRRCGGRSESIWSASPWAGLSPRETSTELYEETIKCVKMWCQYFLHSVDFWMSAWFKYGYLWQQIAIGYCGSAFRSCSRSGHLGHSCGRQRN